MPPFAVCRVLFTVVACCLLCVGSRLLLFGVYCFVLFDECCLVFVCCLLNADCRLLFVVCCLLCVVLFVVCCFGVCRSLCAVVCRVVVVAVRCSSCVACLLFVEN